MTSPTQRAIESLIQRLSTMGRKTILPEGERRERQASEKVASTLSVVAEKRGTSNLELERERSF